MAFNDPRTMSRSELMMWLKKFLQINNKNTLHELIDQWDLHDKIIDIEIHDNFIKDTSKVQLKSTNTKFLKVYHEEIYKMFNDNKIEALDVGYIILLGTFVDYEDNTLKNEDGSYLTLHDMMRVLRISDSTAKRFLKRMIDTNIIFKKLDETDKFKRRNKFFVNPHILYKGKYIDKKIKQKLDQLRKEAKELAKNKTKENTSGNVFSMFDKLQEMDFTDMSDDEIDTMSEELYDLIS